MTKVALSGAGGQLGRFLRPALLDRGVDLAPPEDALRSSRSVPARL